MKQRHGEGVLVLALLAALAACSDSVSRSVAPPSPKDIVSESFSPVTPERGALNHITRLVAMAMDNQPARQRPKRDMRAAPFREHKLQLTAYLSSKDGKALLGRMAALPRLARRAFLVPLDDGALLRRLDDGRVLRRVDDGP